SCRGEDVALPDAPGAAAADQDRPIDAQTTGGTSRSRTDRGRFATPVALERGGRCCPDGHGGGLRPGTSRPGRGEGDVLAGDGDVGEGGADGDFDADRGIGRDAEDTAVEGLDLGDRLVALDREDKLPGFDAIAVAL